VLVGSASGAVGVGSEAAIAGGDGAVAVACELRVDGAAAIRTGFMTSSAGLTAVPRTTPNAVSSTNGAIGYISASFIIQHGLTPAAIQNAAGKYEYPNLRNIENAAASLKSVPSNNEIHIVDPSKKYKIAYPISTFTYCIIPQSAPQKALLAEWVKFALTAGQQYGPALDFATIPSLVLKASEKTLATL
jgi:ABC-type phosphate transport system substrate-binding protein